MRPLLASLVALPVRSATLLSLFAAAPVNAALINVDWQSAGDGLLVRDTDTGLEWLKLTKTVGRSYTQVAGQFAAGGEFAGLRYASNAEVVDLFDEFGISLSGDYGERPIVDPGVRQASETLGDGISVSLDMAFSADADSDSEYANYVLVGYTGDRRLDGRHFAVGARSRLSDTDYFTTEDPVSPLYYAPWEPYTLVTGDDYVDAWIGSYLVRTVAAPLPAAFWLLGSGLLAVGALARRR